jgi:hypothetical protein
MSNLVDHAKRELELLLGGKDDEMQKKVNEDILQLVEIFAKQGHSGMSAEYAISILTRLLKFRPIKPLTGEPDEWGTEVSENQNKRYTALFKQSDGTVIDVNSLVWTDDDGKTWFRRGGTNKFPKVEFPYTPPTQPTRRIYLSSNGEKVLRIVDGGTR